MPEKPLTIATYAAGASLAAITLVYVFGPTFFLDGEGSPGLKPSTRRPVVGLVNPANDCFINSVLQALAGLPDLRKYLIRELHRRKLDGSDVYKITAEDVEGSEKGAVAKLSKLEGLRAGIVTQALKDILDKLNERPIYKKTISAQEFVIALEYAFHTRISRQQQDAQEFLQVVTERLCDEYHAGLKARQRARSRSLSGLPFIHGGKIPQEIPEDFAFAMPPTPSNTEDKAEKETDSTADSSPSSTSLEEAITVTDDELPEEEGFPFEGKMESHIECQHCHFKPKPSESNFVTLTLAVPQKSSTTLNHCFDGMFRVETIDDFKCDRCRLEHALSYKKKLLASETNPKIRAPFISDIERIQKALDDDPETPPEGVQLPDLKLAPARQIQRHMRISSFPRLLGIHLSRSMYSASSLSQKNMAKVTFPETLPLGGILNQRKYRLLGVVTHKGGHNSGHYETFRRQVTSVPFSTPHSFGAEGVYSQSLNGSAIPSAVQSPRLGAQSTEERRSSKGVSKRHSGLSPMISPTSEDAGTSAFSTPNLASASETSLSSRSSFSISGSLRRKSKPPTSAPKEKGEVIESTSPAEPAAAGTGVRPSTVSSKIVPNVLGEKARAKRKAKKRDNLWWRVSDDKVKESKTTDVLGMQKEVYLLFYELIKGEEEDD
ncbi:cysteine proteinase [Venturia nashicola]|nr:cysteine proteinase [Venturia nashicola]